MTIYAYDYLASEFLDTKNDKAKDNVTHFTDRKNR